MPPAARSNRNRALAGGVRAICRAQNQCIERRTKVRLRDAPYARDGTASGETGDGLPTSAHLFPTSVARGTTVGERNRHRQGANGVLARPGKRGRSGTAFAHLLSNVCSRRNLPPQPTSPSRYRTSGKANGVPDGCSGPWGTVAPGDLWKPAGGQEAGFTGLGY
jgi:hypothetical protein